LRNRFAAIIILSISFTTAYAENIFAQAPVILPQPKLSITDPNLINNLDGARSLIRAGDYDRALNLLLSLKKTYGDIHEINIEIKNAYRFKKDYAPLKELILKEMASTKDSFDLYCQLGEVYFLTDSLDQAMRNWDRAFKLAGQLDYRYLILANYYHDYGYYDEAASVYKRGRTILNKPDLYRDELLDIYISQKNYSEAIGEYLGLLKAQPDKSADIADEIVRLADTVDSSQTSGKADNSNIVIKQIERAISTDSKNPDLYCILGALQIKSGNLKQAFENYKKGDDLSGSKGKYIYNFAAKCFTDDKYTMAIEAADYFIKISGDIIHGPQMLLLKANCLAELGSTQPALELLNNLLTAASDPKLKIDILMTLAYVYEQKLGDLQSAKSAYMQIVDNKALGAIAPKAKLNLAEIQLKLGDYDKASALLDQLAANEQYRDLSERAVFLQGELALFTYNFDQASKIYKSLPAKYSSGVYVNDCLDRLALLDAAKGDSAAIYAANAYRQKYCGHADSAMAYMEKAANVNGSAAAEYVIFNLGKFYEDNKNWLKAAETYERYNAAYKDGLYIDRSIFGLAIIYYENLAQPDKANTLFNRLMTDFPASPLIEKARAYLNKIKAS
jgi:tetratricopeptide (TPR) repeat protein